MIWGTPPFQETSTYVYIYIYILYQTEYLINDVMDLWLGVLYMIYVQ